MPHLIDCATIRHEDGTVYTCPRPMRHHDVIAKMVREGCAIPIEGEQGFVLESGQFIGRAEAAKLALASGQCAKLAAPPYLYSEDLW